MRARQQQQALEARLLTGRAVTEDGPVVEALRFPWVSVVEVMVAIGALIISLRDAWNLGVYTQVAQRGKDEDNNTHGHRERQQR